MLNDTSSVQNYPSKSIAYLLFFQSKKQLRYVTFPYVIQSQNDTEYPFPTLCNDKTMPSVPSPRRVRAKRCRATLPCAVQQQNDAEQPFLTLCKGKTMPSTHFLRRATTKRCRATLPRVVQQQNDAEQPFPTLCNDKTTLCNTS